MLWFDVPLFKTRNTLFPSLYWFPVAISQQTEYNPHVMFFTGHNVQTKLLPRLEWEGKAAVALWIRISGNEIQQNNTNRKIIFCRGICRENSFGHRLSQQYWKWDILHPSPQNKKTYGTEILLTYCGAALQLSMSK